MNKIKVLIKRPGEPPRSVWISDTLMTYPRKIYSMPPAGTELKRRVSLAEVIR